MGPKWDGPEMGHSEPKWDGPEVGRARNGQAQNSRPKMAGPKWVGPKWPGPKWDRPEKEDKMDENEKMENLRNRQIQIKNAVKLNKKIRQIVANCTYTFIRYFRVRKPEEEGNVP